MSAAKIKKDINRRGGFGVNGFYLPMNDSSNPGADFHCSPNSIITLKGEDLPQPRNGAPTTSDSYVSQLRTQTGGLFNDGVVDFGGPVAAFKIAIVVKRLPKTRSGKVLRGTMRKIADKEDYKMPATIDDPAILDEIKESLIENKILN